MDNPLFASLSARARGRLENAGVETLEQLVDQYSDGRLWRLRNYGRKTHSEIGVFLAQQNVVLPPSQDGKLKSIRHQVNQKRECLPLMMELQALEVETQIAQPLWSLGVRSLNDLANYSVAHLINNGFGATRLAQCMEIISKLKISLKPCALDRGTSQEIWQQMEDLKTKAKRRIDAIYYQRDAKLAPLAKRYEILARIGR